MLDSSGETHGLVDDAVHLQGLHHVGDELRVCVGVPDLVVKQSPHTPLREQMSRDVTN